MPYVEHMAKVKLWQIHNGIAHFVCSCGRFNIWWEHQHPTLNFPLEHEVRHSPSKHPHGIVV